MRFILPFFLFLLPVPFFLLPARAYDVEVDGICYNLIGTQWALVTHHGQGMMDEGQGTAGYVGDIVIPEQISCNGNTYTVISVGEGAFAGCDELISVKLPSTVRAVSNCGFLGCTGLKQVSLSPSILAFGSCAFIGCTSLQQISLPRQAELVDTLTLYCCASLSSIALPHRIKKVCQGALEHLPALTDLYCFASVPPLAEQGAFTFSDQQHSILHVPSETLSLYQNAPIWSDFSQVIALSDEDYLEQGYCRGDINGDGRTDAEDLTMMQHIIVSLPVDVAVQWAADVNGDGIVNAIDYVLLSKQIYK